MGSALHEGRFQDLTRFRLPEGYRGRSAWFVQLWWLFDALVVRPSPQVLYFWRRFALRMFGARIGRNVLIRPGVRVTFPWKVEIGDHCWIGDNATLYSIAEITIGESSVVSQDAYLCTATHDHSDISFSLVASPIIIEPECWIAARAFVGPGVRIGRGAVVGACSVLLSDVPPATIVAGTPARTVGTRKVWNGESDERTGRVPDRK
jgi:putative colanic acid biosynthesis acetyltransferase WcaF